MAKLIFAFGNFANTPQYFTFCPHPVFVWSVCISQQTPPILLQNINWSVFVTNEGGVYCAVGTEPLNVVQANLNI